MAVKLSREFYDRFGDKVVDELVGLLNEMDSTFRTQLRALNEQNLPRYEAKVEQRIAELRVEDGGGDLRAAGRDGPAPS